MSFFVFLLSSQIMKYNVVFETRSRNSIGAFYPHSVEVEAKSSGDAGWRAMEACHAKNLETRFPISCKEIVDKE